VERDNAGGRETVGKRVVGNGNASLIGKVEARGSDRGRHGSSGRKSRKRNVHVSRRSVLIDGDDGESTVYGILESADEDFVAGIGIAGLQGPFA